MDTNQKNDNVFDNFSGGQSRSQSSSGGSVFDKFTGTTPEVSPRQPGPPIDTAAIDSFATQEGADHLRPVIAAIYGQESGSGTNAVTSTDGARGGMQIIPATFNRFARAGERIDNPDDNMRVGIRYIKSLGDKYGNDNAKIAAGYFSGEGNVNQGEGTAWKQDRADGNGKSVSSYVSDVLGRVGAALPPGAPTAATPPQKTPAWAEITAKPAFALLSPEKQAETKAVYFDTFIAPRAGKDAPALRQRFMELGQVTKPGVVDQVGSGMNALRDWATSSTPESVLTNAPPAPDLPTTSKAPVERKVRQALEAAFDAATPEQRQVMQDAPGWRGMLARDRAGVFARVDANGPSPTLAAIDPRVEARRDALIAKGEDPRFAERAAQDGAQRSVPPGQEIAALNGTVQTSTFDFETKKLFDPEQPMNGLNNPLGRGLAKGGLGMVKAASGMTEALYDAMGADEFSKLAKARSNDLRGKEGAIGEHGDMLSRNFEGAVSSIAQQLPLLLGGTALASQAIPLAGMAVQSFGQEYSDGKAKGQTPAQAAMRAGAFAAFEVIGEKFGLGESMAAIKGAARGMPSEQIVGFLWAALRKEVPGEFLTTTGQFAVDKWAPGGVALNPKATGEDYLKQMADTFVQTIMQGALMAGGTTGVSKAVRFSQERGPSEGVANADAELAKAQALNKWEAFRKSGDGLPATKQEAPQASATPDGRIEPTLEAQPTTPAATTKESSVVEPAPIVSAAPTVKQDLTVQPPTPVVPEPTAQLTDEQEARAAELWMKSGDGTMTPQEQVELQTLQAPAAPVAELPQAPIIEAPKPRTEKEAKAQREEQKQSEELNQPIKQAGHTTPAIETVATKEIQDVNQAPQAVQAEAQGPAAPAEVAPTSTPAASTQSAPIGVTPVTQPTPIEIPAVANYYITGAPAYEGIDPLSPEDADFELEALGNKATKGRLTPESFAASEIGRRLDGATIQQINKLLRSDPVRTIEALRNHVANRSKKNAPAPAEVAPPKTEKEAKARRAADPTHLGRDNTPLSEGGKPFKTKEDAQAARKLQPMLRVVKTKDAKGFALAPKSDQQLAAEEKAGNRLSLARTGTKGVPMAAHEFIATEGGMDASTKSEFSFGNNPRVGNRTLFAGARGGMTIEAATEKLIERGYLPAGASHSDTVALVNRSFTNPQYTPDGTEVMAQAEANTRFEDHLAAQQEAAQADDFDPFASMEGEGRIESDTIDTGYAQASAEIQQEVAALSAQLDAMGIDAEEIRMDIGMHNPKASNQEYYELTKAAIQSAIDQQEAITTSRGDFGQNNGEPSQAPTSREANTDQGLTAPTRADVLAQQDRTEATVKAEKAKKRADDELARRAQERKDIAHRSESAADTFELGQDPLQSLSGQGGMFDEPAQAKPEAPKAETFIKAPDGSFIFGEITPEMSKAMRRQAGKIRLRQGSDAWGLTHIEQRHAEQFKRLGYASAQEFVASVAGKFDSIYQREGSALDVVFSDGEHGRLVVQLEPSKDGDFYDVKTASPIREDQYKNKKPIWERTGTSTPISSKGNPPSPEGQIGSESVAQTAKENKQPTKFNRKDDNVNHDDTDPGQADNSPTTSRAIDAIEQRLGRSYAISHPVQGWSNAGIEATLPIAKAFGTTVVGYQVRGNQKAADTFNMGGSNGFHYLGYTFLNASADRPHLAILGHETAHEMKRKRPDLYAQLVKQVTLYIKTNEYETKFRGSAVAPASLSTEAQKEEFMGEVLSDAFMDPIFWHALGKQNPSLLQRVAKFVSDLINKAIAATGYTKRTEQYLSDYTRVMEIAGEVMAEYGLTPPVTKQAGELVFSRGHNNEMNTSNQGGRSADDTTPGVTVKDIAAAWDALGIKNSIFEKNGTIELSRIEVPKSSRNLGVGTGAMQKLLNYADSTGQRITLTPSSYFGGSKTRLIDFYKSLGFKENKGRSRDFTTRDTMIREPNTNESTALDSYGTNPDIRFNRKDDNPEQGADAPIPTSAQQPAPLHGGANASMWDSPAPFKNGKLGMPDKDMLIYNVQDRQITMKRVMEQIRKTGIVVPEQFDAYQKEELYHGRVAARTHKFLDREIKPLLMDMKLKGVSMDELEAYLWARHATERNESIALINPELPDGGSGLTHEQAKGFFAGVDVLDEDGVVIIKGMKQDDRQRLADLATRVADINQGTQQVLVQYGLETADTMANWNSAYKNYVPLHREGMDTGTAIGQGMSTKGSATKSALGSKLRVVDILAHLALQREAAITRGEKNRVGLSLYGLATQNKNADFWETDTVPMIKRINKDTGLVERVPDMNWKNHENSFLVRVGGQDRAVIFNPRNERAVHMVKVLKNLDLEAMGDITAKIAPITRYFAAISTQYNPVFGVVNGVRDVQAAALNMTSTKLAGKQAAFAAAVPGAMKAIWAIEHGGESGTAYDALYEDMQMAGGTTGYREIFRMGNERDVAIQKEITAQDAGATRRSVTKVLTVLDQYNTAIENGTRLAVFKVAKDMGLSNDEAASIAKNITVNFNRKGKLASELGPWYMFLNSSIQGSARFAETMQGPAGKKLLLGMLAMGVAQQLIGVLAFGDDEWKDIPEYVKQRNFIIPVSGKTKKGGHNYITMPMPLTFNIIPSIGRIGTELAGNGGKNLGKRTIDMMMMIAEAGNPFGSSTPLQVITPTILDIPAAIYENRDFTGRDIAKTDMNALKPTPGFTRARDVSSHLARGAAKLVNTATGGTSYTPGMWSPTPDQLDYVFGALVGGVGREVNKVYQTAELMAKGEDVPESKKLLIGRFFGTTNEDATVSARYWTNVRELNLLEMEIKGMRKDHKDTTEFKSENPTAAIINRADSIEQVIAGWRSDRHKIEFDEKITEEVRTAKLKAKDEQILVKMRQLNAEIAALSKAKKKAGDAK